MQDCQEKQDGGPALRFLEGKNETWSQIRFFEKHPADWFQDDETTVIVAVSSTPCEAEVLTRDHNLCMRAGISLCQSMGRRAPTNQ